MAQWLVVNLLVFFSGYVEQWLVVNLFSSVVHSVSEIWLVGCLWIQTLSMSRLFPWAWTCCCSVLVGFRNRLEHVYYQAELLSSKLNSINLIFIVNNLNPKYIQTLEVWCCKFRSSFEPLYTVRRWTLGTRYKSSRN